MIIEFMRASSSDVAGLSVAIDTEGLPLTEATRLVELVNRLKPQRIERGLPAHLVYTIKTTIDESIRIYRIIETPEHKELIHYMINKAISAK